LGGAHVERAQARVLTAVRSELDMRGVAQSSEVTSPETTVAMREDGHEITA